MELTKFQRETILREFFQDPNYAGWKNIANKLIDNGMCVVAGNECIWKGGIGNFIETSEDPQFFDCLKYTFNLEDFMKTKWYKETIELRIAKKSEAVEERKKEYEELKGLL